MGEKVSVIIPTKNRVEALKRSLDSVFCQTLAPYEIIVVDDGSEDNTIQVVKSNYPNINLIRNRTSRGGAVARNQGADLAKGNYLAFLDSDDVWLPNHLSNKIRRMNETDADAAFGNFILVKRERETEIVFKADYPSNGNVGNLILSPKRFDARTSTFVFIKEAFLKVKFDENLKKHQDWDLAINFDNLFKWCKDDIPTVRILIEQGEERMSQKLQHDSSFYFIEKNRKFINSNNLFTFCLKQIMRSQLAKEPRHIIEKYLEISKSVLSDLNSKNKALFYILKYRIINIGTAYRVISKFR